MAVAVTTFPTLLMTTLSHVSAGDEPVDLVPPMFVVDPPVTLPKVKSIAPVSSLYTKASALVLLVPALIPHMML